jgi:hypothetical protein
MIKGFVQIDQWEINDIQHGKGIKAFPRKFSGQHSQNEQVSFRKWLNLNRNIYSTLQFSDLAIIYKPGSVYITLFLKFPLLSQILLNFASDNLSIAITCTFII